MDNKATTKRMIGAVVLVLVAALLLAWLLKGKNRDGQQDLAMNQTAETKPILGFPGVGSADQKPTIVGEDPNAVAQQQGAGIEVTQQAPSTAQQTGVASLIPSVDVKLPETVPNTTGFDVRPVAGGEVRDLVDTDGKVKDGTGSMGTGDAKAGTPRATGSAPAAAPAVDAKAPAAADTRNNQAAAPSASQKDKPAAAAEPEEKKPSSKVVLVNEKPVPRATSEAGAAQAAAAKKAAEEKAAAAKAAADKAAAEKAAAAKSVALAGGGAAAGTAAGGAGSFSIQVLASSDKAKADAAAAPLKADGHNVSVASVNVGGKTVYRVSVTGFADRAAAEAAQAKMKSRYKQNQAIQGSFVTSSK